MVAVNHIFDKLKSSGVNPDDFLDKMKLLEICADMIESLSVSITDDLKEAGLYQRNLKQEINKVALISKKYVRNFDRNVAGSSIEASIQYGELSDEILKLSISYLKQIRKPDENNK
jgi:hypothetical protein